VQPATFPEGYALHELPADYTGKLWIEGQVRYLHRLTAAQRQWVGLTNDERGHIINNSMTPACVVIATETKLKEKNNG
jgi:hypothetical protein